MLIPMSLAKVSAIDVLEHDVEEASVLAHVVNRDDVRMNRVEPPPSLRCRSEPALRGSGVKNLRRSP